MPSTYKNCQSCGMPMSRDSEGGGTNADGSKSTMYCSHCWAKGRFTMPDLTASQMQERVKGRIEEMGFPAILSWFFTRNVPKLARWSGASQR